MTLECCGVAGKSRGKSRRVGMGAKQNCALKTRRRGVFDKGARRRSFSSAEQPRRDETVAGRIAAATKSKFADGER